MNVMISASAVAGFLAVGLGAFGAHGLKNRLDADMMAVYQTAVQYHFYHALALLAVGLLIQFGGSSTALKVSGWSFALGIVVFSGSLYALSLSGVRVLGAITPIGGLMFLVGWAALLVASLRSV